MAVPRVTVTDRAKEVIENLKKEHGELVFHQSGGCCDGSAPMCFPKDEFMVGACDVKVGNIAGCDFFMAEDQFEYNQYTQLIIDVVEGRGSSFSLEIPLGLRFVAKPRLFTKEELEDLEPVERME